LLPLEKEEKKKKMREVIDIRTIIEDIIKVSLKTRKKNPKERNMIDVRKMTLFASHVVKRETLVNTVTFKKG